MRKIKTIVSVILVLVLLIGTLPVNALTVQASIWPDEAGTITAGEVAKVTCNGGGSLSSSNIIFKTEGVTLANITGYNADGTVYMEKKFCNTGGDSQIEYYVYGGKYFIVEVLYGTVELSYNLSVPDIQVESGKSVDKLIDVNFKKLFLTVDDTADYKLTYILEGYDCELSSTYYGNSAYESSDSNVATVDKNGRITAVGEGTATISMVIKFGIYGTNQVMNIKRTCQVEVVGDYGIQDAYANYYAEGNDKYFKIINPADGETKTTGFDIQVGEDVYNTGEDNQMMITFPDGYNEDVLISKEGFIPYTLKSELINSYNFITLYKESDDPVVQSVMMTPAGTDSWTNLKLQSMSIVENSEDEYLVNVAAYWGKYEEKGVWLEQGDTKISLYSDTTNLVKLGQYIKKSEDPVYICLQTTEGKVYKSKILLNVYSKSEIFATDFGDEGGVETETVEDVDYFDGKSFSIKLSGHIPMSYTVDKDGKVKGTLGVKETAASKEATYYEELKETITKTELFGKDTSKTSKELTKLKNKIKKNGGDLAYTTKKVAFDCDYALLGYFEGQMVNGELKINEVGAIVEIKGSASLTSQSLAFAIPHYWKVELETALTTQIISVGANESGNWVFKMPEIELKVTFTGTLAAGVDKLAGVGVKLEAALSGTWDTAGSIKDSVIKLNAKFYPFAQILGMEYSEDYWDDLIDWQLYPYEDPEFGISLAEVQADAAFVQMDRNYENSVELSALYNVDNDSVILEDVYYDADPQIVKINDKQIMVWVGDEKERTSENRTCLYYSVYDELTDKWSTASKVYDDGKADFEPVLKLIDEKVVLVWQKATELLAEGTTLSETASKLDIYYSEFDLNSETFTTPVNLCAENTGYDSNVTVLSVAGNITVIWSENTAADLFGAEGTNTIYAATLGDNGWVSETKAEGLKTISGIAACEKDGNVVIYYAADTDEDYATSEDMEIFSIENGVITQLTDNEIIDAKPQVLNGVLYWYAQGELTDGNVSVDFPSDEYEYSFISNEDGSVQAVLYTIGSGLNNNLYATVNDGNGWGKAVQLTDLENSYITDYSGYINGDNISVVINKREVAEEAKLGAASVMNVSAELEAEIVTEDIAHDMYSLTKGGVLKGYVEVSNAGLKSVNGLIASVRDINGNLIANTISEVVLLPGESTNVEFMCKVEDIIGNEISVTITGESSTETDLSNNTCLLQTAVYDTSVENSFAEIDSSGITVVNSFVVNRGLTDINDIVISYYKNAPDGELLGTQEVAALKTGESKLLKFESDKLVVGEAVYIRATGCDDENILANNENFAFVIDKTSDAYKDVFQVVVDEPDDITEGYMKTDYTYFIKTGEESGTLVGKFICEEAGYYRIDVTQSDKDRYPYTYENIDVEVKLGEWNQVSNEAGRVLNEIIKDKKYCTWVGAYYLEQGEEYEIEFECQPEQLAEVVLSKAKLPEKISFNKEEVSIQEGDYDSGPYIITEPDLSFSKYIFTSSDESVVKVDDDGFLNAYLPGTAIITAKIEGTDVSASYKVIVTDIEETKLTISKNIVTTEGYYYIVPEEAGYYTFNFKGASAEILDENRDSLAYLSNLSSSDEFKFTCEYLEKGKTYYIDIKYSESDTITGSIQKIKAPEEISVYNNPMELYEGYGKDLHIYSETEGTYFDANSAEYEFSKEGIVEITYKGNEGYVEEDGESYSSTVTLQALKEGKTTLTITTKEGVSTSVDINVKKYKTVKKLEIASLPEKMEYYEGYAFNDMDLSGLTLKATMSDGSIVQWNYDDYVNQIGESYVYIDYYNVDEDGKVYIECEDVKLSFDVSIVEIPVKSLELVSGKIGPLPENAYGWPQSFYDENTQEIVYDYYHYSYTISDNVKVKINYKDGSSKIAGFDEAVDGYYLQFIDNQYENHWELGKDNYLLVSYLGVETTIPVEIIENPVEKIEIVTAPTRVYEYGDNEYGYYDEEYDIYEFYPTDLSGLVFKVYYKDGTTKTVKHVDDENKLFEGYKYYISDSCFYDLWDVKPGTFTMELEYMGKVAEYDIILKEGKDEAGKILYGDTNKDKIINSSDALEILKIAAKIIETNEYAEVAGDVDGNNQLDAADALNVLKYAAKIINKFPVEQ